MTGQAGRHVYIGADMEGITGLVDAQDVQPVARTTSTAGALSHSLMGHEIDDIWLNGRPAGEIGLAQATAAALGVPVAAMHMP